MPLVQNSSYRPPFGFHSGHLQTIYPSLFRKLALITDRRERISTPDGDFLDLDWADKPTSKKLAILTHGLEGSSRRTYIQGMAQALTRSGWNVLAWNFRGCSGEANHRLESYHSGSIGELKTVIAHAASSDRYEQIALIGFSLGGNITLKLLGDPEHPIHPKVKGAVTFSVSTNLASSAKHLERLDNRIYMRRFLKTLRGKVREKVQRFPGVIRHEGLDQMRTFREFDDAYTAPIHGFVDAEDYWQQSSSGPHLDNITIPTLLVNAKNDPFLTSDCYPTQSANGHPHLHLEIPESGGHIGFIEFNRENTYWSERRAVNFLKAQMP
jgi:hypothetical protein